MAETKTLVVRNRNGKKKVKVKRKSILKPRISQIRKEYKKRQPRSYVDYTMLLLIILLLAFGLVMLYSTSSYTANLKYGDSLHYLKRQLVFAVVGIGVMFGASKVPYGLWKRFAGWFYAGTLILCASVKFIGTSSNGSTRWIQVGPITIQPSEIGKIAAIFFTAYIISTRTKAMLDIRKNLIPLALMAPLIIVVAVENLSTAIIITGIVVFMIFVSSPDYKWYIGAAIVIGILGVIGVNMLGGYRSVRIQSWLHPESADPDDVYQTLQALYAIGSGGLFGKGLGESMQKSFVPEAQNDMIFSIICEELGIFGAVCVIILFLVFLWRLMTIAIHCNDLFGSYVVVGVMVHIALQFIMNIAVVTNSMPNTGVTLPFISYGGTALLITMAEMGVVLSISKNTDDAIDGISF